MKETTTTRLTNVLKKASGAELEEYYDENSASLLEGERPFSDYMRSEIKAAGLKQQDVFLAADIPERYGYKLISGEKRTRDRDVVLRLCIGAGFNLEKTQKALTLCGMAQLYPRFKRDSALMIALNTGVRDVFEADELLEKHGLPKLSAKTE